MPKNMHGEPQQLYEPLNRGYSYMPDAAGLITDVADADIEDMVSLGCVVDEFVQGVPLILPIVNEDVGSFHVASVTVDAEGRVIGASEGLPVDAAAGSPIAATALHFAGPQITGTNGDTTLYLFPTKTHGNWTIPAETGVYVPGPLEITAGDTVEVLGRLEIG